MKNDFRLPASLLDDLILRIAGEKLRNYAAIRLKWESVVGKNTAANANPVFFDKGVLKVAVSNNIWLQELILYKHKIRARYKKLYDINIENIIFFIGTE